MKKRIARKILANLRANLACIQSRTVYRRLPRPQPRGDQVVRACRALRLTEPELIEVRMDCALWNANVTHTRDWRTNPWRVAEGIHKALPVVLALAAARYSFDPGALSP